MKFKLLLLVEDGPSVDAEVLLDTDDPGAIARVRTSLPEMNDAPGAPAVKSKARRAGAPGRKVVVLSVDEDEAPPGIETGRVFASASELDFTLGYRFSAVAQALHRAEGSSAWIQGIEVQYQDIVEQAPRKEFTIARKNSRPVVVLSLTEDAPCGFDVGMVFPSARRASQALRYRYNAVAQALGGAGGEAITLQGVQLQYLDDVPGA